MLEPDPLDLMEPAELTREAERQLEAALAVLEKVGRSLRGEPPLPRETCPNIANVLPFSARSRKPRRGRNAVG